jgi:putative membrane protein
VAPSAGVGNAVDYHIKTIEVVAAIKEDAEPSAGECVMVVPYCGSPPSPGELWERFNLDPLLLLVLSLFGVLLIWMVRGRWERRCAALGWTMAFAAFVSPLCALSVSLFSARIAQHMILLLVAAPFIALALPRAPHRNGSWQLRASAGMFFVALWFWHMPDPYDATFNSTSTYWLMHSTLFGSGILLWRELLHHRPNQAVEVFAVGAITCMQMGFLGAILALAGRPLFSWHFTTTAVWGLSPLQDQQLGGTLMWVPGILLFLWVAIRSLERLWSALEGAKAA